MPLQKNWSANIKENTTNEYDNNAVYGKVAI